MLLDAASLYFRAYYGVPESITSPDGTPINAVRGFTDMVARLVTERRPTRLVACLDLDWRPAFRVEALPSYKAHRVPGEPEVAPAGMPEEVPDTLAPQVPVLLEVLAAVGIATAGAEGYEADDVIGTLAAGERKDPVLAVSGDRDLMQIVRDEPVPVRLLYVGRGLAKAEHLGPGEVAAKYGVPADRAGDAYAEMAMLRGDPSDGLPGVPGVGAKTAATLVGRFASWAELRAAVTDRADTRLAPPVRAKLAAAAPYLAVVEPVVRVALDAPVQLDRSDTLPRSPADPDRLAALAERWGVGSSVDRLCTALAKNA
ncbi:5'-3' exonuclease [Pseudonocardia xinjiangensis]|uniref:5'-3' exonuclease n=1 Tax=Pseudonocardia xinjiangensis TaxID=75289 RepID=A0ABX1RIT4_9PSEU|nr:5'-3' exonuclease H3TH domain-containing protein [Pseudonocardia xinjiangensis]NMH80282.1 flap endonuclease [Pseudonocardia xinjiangensis]